MKRTLRRLASLLLAIGGLFAFTGVASATVVVPPGGSGSTCSGYSHVSSNWYWQTCAWADDNEVYFTVNFGNASSGTWYPDITWVDYIRSGSRVTCGAGIWYDFPVPAHSVKSTPTATCAIPRQSAAYAAVGQVWDGSGAYHVELHSPTLQVQ